MATTVNAGRNFFIQDVTITTTDTAVTVPAVLTNPQRVNSMLVRCRSAVDIYLKLNKGDGNYFTIPSGTTLSLDISTSSSPCFYLQSSSGTVIVEILMNTD